MFRMTIPTLLCLCAALPQTHAATQDEESVQDLLRKAQQHLQSGDNEAAAKAFRKVTDKDKDNAQGWFMLGYALHMGGKLDDAIKAHEKAAGFQQTRMLGLYNLGCAYALKGQKDRAFGYLNQSVKAGFQDEDQLDGDSDLESLRKDVRYKRLEKRVQGESVTDDFTPKDLIGRWVVVSETQGGKKNEKTEGFVEVAADNYSMVAPGGKQGPLPYKVDTSTEVPTIVVGGRAKGIMKMDGERLTVCLNPSGEDAPTAIKSTEENGFNVLVVRRVLTPAKIKGVWEYVSGTRSGEKVAAERLVGQVTVTEKTFTLPASPTENFVMAYSLNATAAIDTINLEIESGPVPEGRAVGVIKVEGDTLTLCYDSTGMNRPTDFAAEEEGFFAFVLKRKAAASK